MELKPEMKQKPLEFVPVNDGLGFHPFSDGLPYAPMGKGNTGHASISRAAAAGASAAGKPTYAPMTTKLPPRPNNLAPRISVPVAAKSAPQPTAPHRTFVPTAPSAPRTMPAQPPRTHKHSPFTAPLQQRPVISPAAPKLQELAEQQAMFGFGYLVKRLFAYCFDTLFNLGLCLGALSLALWNQDLSPDLLISPGIAMVALLFLCVFNWAITTAQEVAFSTTLGKRLFGLALNGSATAIFLRAFFFLPSVGFAGIGLIWALFDRRKRCWHDLVVDLQPTEIAYL